MKQSALNRIKTIYWRQISYHWPPMTNPLTTTPKKLIPSQIIFWNDIAFAKKETHLQIYRLLKNKFPKFHWLWIRIKNFPGLIQSSFTFPLPWKKRKTPDIFSDFSTTVAIPQRRAFKRRYLSILRKANKGRILTVSHKRGIMPWRLNRFYLDFWFRKYMFAKA